MKHIAAALLFFTRLPLWRLKAFRVASDYFAQVIYYWAPVGWLTGGVMAGTLWLTAQVLPYPVAVILALLSRLLLTGALHEDGLADVADGFGGGSTRERILAIMKDSHIGTYGVVALIVYFLLLHNLLVSLPLPLACAAILAGDPLCKSVSSFMTCFLLYARTATTNKIGVVYEKISVKPLLVSLCFGLTPMCLWLDYRLWWAALFPLVTFFLLIYLMKRKIQGYTGDCCGTMFLLCELTFYLGVVVLFSFLSV